VASLSRAPGWEPETWGYHGDDGHCFAAQTVGKAYGPRFGTGDTVGCLVNFRLGQAMFTLNGKELGMSPCHCRTHAVIPAGMARIRRV
jgi:hypothetical protein